MCVTPTNIEQNGHLPFLGVLVEKRGEHLTMSVYQKCTHIDRYIQLASPSQSENRHHLMPNTKSAQHLWWGQTWSRKQTQGTFFWSKWIPNKISKENTDKTRTHSESPDDQEKPRKLLFPYSSEAIEGVSAFWTSGQFSRRRPLSDKTDDGQRKTRQRWREECCLQYSEWMWPPLHRHRRLQSWVGTWPKLGYAAFDVQLRKCIVTTLFAIRMSVCA